MFDHPQPVRLWVWVLLACLLSIQGVWAASDEEDSNAAPASASAEGGDAKAAKRKITIPNKRCLKCHADEDEKTSEREDGTIVNIFVDEDQFEASVHGKQPCIGCHNSITKAQHDQPLPKSIGCVECHREKWKEQLGSDDPKYKRLDVVISQIDSYMRSIHARPNLKDQSRTNATCYDCHDAHNIGTIGSIQRAEHRQKNPEVCGRCHEEQKDTYETSVHGKAVLEKHNADSAVCSDCHTTHNIDSPEQDAVKLAITQNCGRCHEKQVKTYRASYHGQVTRLGYAHTAKCFDCHGSHGIMDVKDPRSKVHDNNRLETCRQCHKNAPEGYLGFHAHGDVHDRARYPEMWIAKRFMDVLILGVFLFFWTHMLLWIYREWRDGKEGKGYQAQPGCPRAGLFPPLHHRLAPDPRYPGDRRHDARADRDLGAVLRPGLGTGHHAAHRRAQGRGHRPSHRRGHLYRDLLRAPGRGGLEHLQAAQDLPLVRADLATAQPAGLQGHRIDVQVVPGLRPADPSSTAGPTGRSSTTGRPSGAWSPSESLA